MNDIFYFITHCKIYNYADDTTVSYWHREANTLKQILAKEGLTLLDWFDSNHMQANLDKSRLEERHLSKWSISQ